MSVTDWSKAINLLYQQPLHNLKSTTLTLTHLCWHDKIRVRCLLLAVGSGKLHWFSNLFLTSAQPTFSCCQTLSHLNCECCCSGHLTRMCCLHGDLSWNLTFHIVLLYRFYLLINWHSYTLSCRRMLVWTKQHVFVYIVDTNVSCWMLVSNQIFNLE